MCVIVVTGGRDHDDEEFVHEALSSLPFEITRLVHGNARGVDTFAKTWAELMDIEATAYPADWDAHGPAAGPLRNEEMIEKEPDIMFCIAFDGGTGTNDMVRRCRKAGIERIFFNKPISMEESIAKWG